LQRSLNNRARESSGGRAFQNIASAPAFAPGHRMMPVLAVRHNAISAAFFSGVHGVVRMPQQVFE
jgi:hypothetical protein